MLHTFETCAKHARNVRNALRESRETCAKHVRNIANHRESANHQRILRNIAKHRETCAKHARNVRNALRESRETSRNMRETCAKRRVPRVTYRPSIGIRYTSCASALAGSTVQRRLHAITKNENTKQSTKRCQGLFSVRSGSRILQTDFRDPDFTENRS